MLLSFLKKSFLFIIVSQISLAGVNSSCWIKTAFLQNKHIDFLMSYKHVYAVGGNDKNQGEAWRFIDGKWQIIYQAINDSIITDTTVFGNIIYAGGDSTKHGGWIVEYLPDTESRVNLHIKFANSITSLDSNQTSLFIGGTGLNTKGSVWKYVPSTQKWTNISPSGFEVINTLIAHQNYLYASGISSKTHKAEIIELKNGKWQDLHLPKGVVSVSNIVSDNENNIYASGIDEDYHAHVWRLKSGVDRLLHHWNNTGLTAQAINNMQINDSGIIYAAGVDIQFHGQVWVFDGKTWQVTNFPLADNVVSLTINNQNQLFAAATDKHNNSEVWMCNLGYK
jgi:hypothetical protein